MNIIEFDKLEKMSDASLKRRLSVLERRTEKIREILEKVRQQYNRKYHWDNEDQNEPRYIYVSRKTGNRMKRQDYYNNLYDTLQDSGREQMSIRRILNNRKGHSLKDYVISFIVMDKKGNPSLYPDWVSFKLDEIGYHGTINVQPFIDLNEMLQQKGDVSYVAEIIRRVEKFWKRYLSNEVAVNFTKIKYVGLDDYVKNVFRKEIKDRVNSELDPKGCVHSIIFKQPDSSSTWRQRIQIVPRFRKFDFWDRDEKSQFCRRDFSEYGFKGKLKTLLSQYGWVEGKNYVDRYEKD
jgi:hypothetical protein